jgi:hypothetical protein
VKVLLDGLMDWLAARGLSAIDSIRGRMRQRDTVRANYIRVLQGY